jgi:hypothetical protein
MATRETRAGLILLGLAACSGQVVRGTASGGGATGGGDGVVDGSAPEAGGGDDGGDGGGIVLGDAGGARRDALSPDGDSDSADASGAAIADAADGGPVEIPCPKPPGEICHEFLAGDNSRHVVNYVNEFDPSRSWTSQSLGGNANSPLTIEVVDNTAALNHKAALVSIDSGYAEIDLANGKLLERQDAFGGVGGAYRMPDGTTALKVVRTIRMIDVNGAELRNFLLPLSYENHPLDRRNPADGHFWFTEAQHIYEMTDQGAVVWTADLVALDGSRGPGSLYVSGV